MTDTFRLHVEESPRVEMMVPYQANGEPPDIVMTAEHGMLRLVAQYLSGPGPGIRTFRYRRATLHIDKPHADYPPLDPSQTWTCAKCSATLQLREAVIRADHMVSEGWYGMCQSDPPSPPTHQCPMRNLIPDAAKANP